MASFVTLDQYATALGITENLGGDVEFALDVACTEIRTLLNQTLSFVEGDEIAVDGTGHQTLLLPELPVVAVNAVTINKGLDTEVVVTDFKVGFGGVLYRRAGWPWGYGNITVDHDHGYDPIPADIINIAIQASRAGAGAAAIDPGLRQETIAGYSYTRDSSAAIVSAVGEYRGALAGYAVKRIPAS